MDIDINVRYQGDEDDYSEYSGRGGGAKKSLKKWREEEDVLLQVCTRFSVSFGLKGLASFS